MVFDILSRRDKDREKWGQRLPGGQKVVEDWPVLTYGGTPRVEKSQWRFRLSGLVEKATEIDMEQLLALPQTTIRCDIHCVTSWSRMDNDFTGVTITDLLKLVTLKPEAQAAIIHCYGGYRTNLLLDDLVRDNCLLSHKHDGRDLEPQHGGPCRLVVPHLYFWKSAKWANGIEFIARDEPGFWERYGYHIRGDPWKEERYS